MNACRCFGIGVIAMILVCRIASALTVTIPHPPPIPANLAKTAAGQELVTQRKTLLDREKAWFDDKNAFNKAAEKEVSEEEAVTLRNWQTKVLAERTAYTAAVNALKVAIAQLKQSGNIDSLRAQVRDTQEALRRLQRQGELTNEELAHWREVTERSVEHAQDMLTDMVIDALISMPSERLGGMYKQMDGELSAQLQRAADLLAGETDGARRERLHAAIKLLGQQRDSVRHLQGLLENFSQAQAAKSVDDLAQLPEAQQLKVGLQELIVASGNEKLQQGLQHDFGFSFPVMTSLAKGVAHYRAAEKVVEAAYDATAVSLAWKQISEQNDTAQRTLDAVGALGDRVETLVGRINELKQPD